MSKTKTRIIGKESYLNPMTGELLEMNVIESENPDVDTNFHKLFLRDFLMAMDIVSNQKTKVAYWILDNLTKDNMLIYSYRDIASKTGISYQTVASTIKTLKDADFLRAEGKNLIINPAIIFKGTASRRANILHRYQQAQTGDTELDAAKRIENLEITIDKLNRQLSALKTIRQNTLKGA